MRCDRGLKSVGIDQIDRQIHIRCRSQGRYIFAYESAVNSLAPGRHRFHADGAQPATHVRPQERGRDERLANAGIGASDENATRGEG